MVNRFYKPVKGRPYSQEVRELVLAEYYRGISRNKLAMQYNITNPTVISHWIRNFEAGKHPSGLPKISYRMPRTKNSLTDHEASQEAEIRRLKKQLGHKDTQLREESKRADRAELKNELLNMLVDIAEKDLNINIRKKSGPKQ